MHSASQSPSRFDVSSRTPVASVKTAAATENLRHMKQDVPSGTKKGTKSDGAGGAPVHATLLKMTTVKSQPNKPPKRQRGVTERGEVS